MTADACEEDAVLRELHRRGEALLYTVDPDDGDSWGWEIVPAPEGGVVETYAERLCLARSAPPRVT